MLSHPHGIFTQLREGSTGQKQGLTALVLVLGGISDGCSFLTLVQCRFRDFGPLRRFSQI